MMNLANQNQRRLAEEVRTGFRHIRDVASALFIMRDQSGGDPRMAGALDLLAGNLEGLADEAQEAFEKATQARAPRPRRSATQIVT